MGSEALLKAMHEAREQLDVGNIDQQSRHQGQRCIAFRVDNECYAIELLVVREVITPPAVVPVPCAPEEVLGVINLRGSVVTVINSRRVLGLKGVPEGAASRVLLVDDDGQQVGVLVDSVDDIVEVPVEAFDATGTSAQTGDSTRFRGTVMLGEDIAFVLHRSGLTRRVA
jgi:purine-binding chemotaxis protein CheW